jgi:hypothetical protein
MAVLRCSTMLQPHLPYAAAALALVLMDPQPQTAFRWKFATLDAMNSQTPLCQCKNPCPRPLIPYAA